MHSITPASNHKGDFMNKLRGRLAFDLILTALLVVEMFFQLTGDFLHEVLGIVFFVTIVAHLVLSRKWISVTSRNIAQGKKLKKGNSLRMAFGIALGITSLALMASSLAISNQLYTLLGISLAGAAYSTWVIVHTISSYLMCCLVAGHLAIHWASVASAFRIPYNHERRAAINAGMTAIVALGVAAIGSRGVDALAIPFAEAGEASLDANVSGSTSTSSKSTGFGAVNDLSGSAEAAASADAASANAQPSATATTTTAKYGKQKGKGRGKQQYDQGVVESAPSNDEWSNDTWSGDSSAYYEENTSDNSSYYESEPSYSESTSSSTVTGYCTLCPKHCPLSAPRCDRPYLEGLL